jgi:anti-sigma regulatory factor (Ser/Thr protein kinase)
MPPPPTLTEDVPSRPIVRYRSSGCHGSLSSMPLLALGRKAPTTPDTPNQAEGEGEGCAVRNCGPPALRESFFYINLPARDRTASVIRDTVRRILGEWEIELDSVDTALLLACELVTNALKFGSDARPSEYRGAADAAHISATLWHRPGLLKIEVTDQSMKPPVMRSADSSEESGRGLILVDALCRKWGYFIPSPGRKTVYCELEVRELGSSLLLAPSGHDRKQVAANACQG